MICVNYNLSYFLSSAHSNEVKIEVAVENSGIALDCMILNVTNHLMALSHFGRFLDKFHAVIPCCIS